jgi:hypothetical protein
VSDNPDLLTKIRDHLIAADVVRDPRVAGDEPPFWRNPEDGAVAPGEKSGTEADDGVVISAFLTDGVTPPDTEQHLHRYDVVTIRVRTAPSSAGAPKWGSKAALDFDWDLRAALLGDTREEHVSFQLGNLTVVELKLWRPLSFIGSDEQGFDYSTGYIVQEYV